MSTSSDAAVADDQPGVAPPPRPVALDVRPAPVTCVVHRSRWPPCACARLDPRSRRAELEAGGEALGEHERRQVRVRPAGTSGNTEASTTWTLVEAVDAARRRRRRPHPARRRGVVDAAGRRRRVSSLDDRPSNGGVAPAARRRRRGPAVDVGAGAPARTASSMAWPGSAGPRWFMAVTCDVAAPQRARRSPGRGRRRRRRAAAAASPAARRGCAGRRRARCVHPDARSSAGVPIAPAATATASAGTTSTVGEPHAGRPVAAPLDRRPPRRPLSTVDAVAGRRRPT